MKSILLIIWLPAAILYFAFLAWHENWRGALTETEINHFMELIDTNPHFDKSNRQVVLDFMRNDKGAEFFMLNLVAFPKGKIKHPDSGVFVTGQELLQSYFQPFAGMIFGSAGYPAYTGLARGDYIEKWGVEANPGWNAGGLIRYRSRRDIMLSVTHPAFSKMHPYKQAALVATLAVPMETSTSLFLSPRWWVGLVLLVIALLSHLIYLTYIRPAASLSNR